MILYTDTNLGCYDFFNTQPAWLRSDQRKEVKVRLLACLRSWKPVGIHAWRRIFAAA